MVAATVYKDVVYVGKGKGTLKLFDNELTFSMFDRTANNNTHIFTLPWTKVAKRQVSSSERTTPSEKPKIKLILRSGTEAVFQMDDRVALEVLRDDVAERLTKYQALYPHDDSNNVVVDEAVNKTHATERRKSTPYRMAQPSSLMMNAPASPPKPDPIARRASQPYRMAKPDPPSQNQPPRAAQPYRMAQASPAPTPNAKRNAQPYRMAQASPAVATAAVTAQRDAQPYRMKAATTAAADTTKRNAQPYRYVAKK